MSPEVEELRAQLLAACSCRFCQLLTTVNGISRHGHGPDSPTCERWRNYIEPVDAPYVPEEEAS